MLEKIELKFRKEKQGPEADLVNNFLNDYVQLLKKDGLNYCILKEVYAEIGIPDILIVIWEGNVTGNWAKPRNKLNITDIKLLHHIYTCGKRGASIAKLNRDLAFAETEIEKSIQKLVAAKLVSYNDGIAIILDVSSSFFIKKIISIEAKICDWKKAFSQAYVNGNFSSHSYVLLPTEKINDNILSCAKGNLGILSHSTDGPKFKMRAKKLKLPGSYFSWVINEYIGRQQTLTS